MTVATIPALLAHLVDGATDLDGLQRLTESIEQHRQNREAWYGELVGPLVVRASATHELERIGGVQALEVAVVADTGMDRIPAAVAALHRAGAQVCRVEAAVAKRGEDPVPGLTQLLTVAQTLGRTHRPIAVHAEIPLTSGLLEALDVLAGAAPLPGPLGAAFRVGGLAGELFPSPVVLAGVICACRDRGLRFSVSAGLDRALRHSDHETGFSHHGVLNVLGACLAAEAGAGQAAVAERLAVNDGAVLTETVLAAAALPRPLWTSFTATQVDDIVTDLRLLDIIAP